MDTMEWLYNKVAADLGLTTKQVTDSKLISNSIMDYAKGIIYNYEDLIKMLHDKINTTQKGKNDAVF